MAKKLQKKITEAPSESTHDAPSKSTKPTQIDESSRQPKRILLRPEYTAGGVNKQGVGKFSKVQ